MIACCDAWTDAPYADCIVILDSACPADERPIAVVVEPDGGSAPCPRQCLIGASIACCAAGCQADPRCADYPVRPSCCTGYCGEWLSSGMVTLNPACMAWPYVSACCTDDGTILRPAPPPGEPTEWAIRFDNAIVLDSGTDIEASAGDAADAAVIDADNAEAAPSDADADDAAKPATRNIIPAPHTVLPSCSTAAPTPPSTTWEAFLALALGALGHLRRLGRRRRADARDRHEVGESRLG